jgi:hypothetical protein
MDDHKLFAGTPGPNGEHTRLARWLQQVLIPTPQDQAAVSHSQVREQQNQLELSLSGDYHLNLYRQLPDLALAVLQNETRTLPRFGSLLYHLVSCQECRTGYLDIYDSLRAALYPEGPRPLLGQGTRTLAATPHRMLAHLCQALITQGEAELRQARHEHTDRDAAARSLLQMALRVSAHITQGTVRREALQDLVRVATLFTGATASADSAPDVHAFTPVLVGGTRGGKVLRRSDSALRPQSQELDAIEIQAGILAGRIVQRGQTLELHLQDLEPALHGRHLTISVLLGSLLEPVRWRGGNPNAIRSTIPVTASGELVMPLGETEMLLHNREERNLLEAMFMLLEVRPSAEI